VAEQAAAQLVLLALDALTGADAADAGGQKW
jgi:hypothetical protein